MNVGAAAMLGLGGFWAVSGAVFTNQMRKGNFEPAKKVHQDMDPSASNRRWWIKIGAVTAVGALWVASGVGYLLNPAAGLDLVKVALGSFVLEQLITPVLAPRHWKAYTGVGLGVALPLLIWVLL